MVTQQQIMDKTNEAKVMLQWNFVFASTNRHILEQFCHGFSWCWLFINWALSNLWKLKILTRGWIGQDIASSKTVNDASSSPARRCGKFLGQNVNLMFVKFKKYNNLWVTLNKEKLNTIFDLITTLKNKTKGRCVFTRAIAIVVYFLSLLIIFL